jgi:hypothetical protein
MLGVFYLVSTSSRVRNKRDDYIRLHKPCTCMAMSKKTGMIIFMFKEFLSLFNKSVPGGVSLSN